MIRQATRYDIPRVLEIVEAYSFENPIKTLGKPANHDPKYVEELLLGIMVGRGFVLIDSFMRGALIAVKQRNVWSPTVRELHELLWWVEPEHRNGTVGGRLWKAFNDIASEMLKTGSVDFVVTSSSASGPQIGYEKRGYKPVSCAFVRE